MRTPKIVNQNGALLISFTFEKNRYRIFPGLRFGDETHRATAEGIILQIQSDCVLGRFDYTLNKYKVKSVQNNEPICLTTIHELFEKYYEKQSKTAAPRTQQDYAKFLEIVKKYKNRSFLQAISLMHEIEEDLSPDRYRRIHVQLNACFNYWTERNVITRNPLKAIKIKKKKTDNRPDPFTLEERNQIIAKSTILGEPYQELIYLLFMVGCRPSEALGLKWTDLTKNSIRFARTWQQGRISEKLKTQKNRTINVASYITESLLKMGKNSDYIFSVKRSLPIDWDRFSQKKWPLVFEELPEIRKRHPYCMRHTFITLMLQNNVSVQDVAAHCGNSPEIVYKHYAGVSRHLIMPEV
ncbi:MAG: tyrosine-type recombinase/integrase [Waterburya sp.]